MSLFAKEDFPTRLGEGRWMLFPAAIFFHTYVTSAFLPLKSFPSTGGPIMFFILHYLVSVRKLMPGDLNIIIRGSYRIILIGFYVC